MNISLDRFFFLILIIVVLSCSKRENSSNSSSQVQKPPVSLGQVLQCYQKLPWDSASIHTQLIGKWNWEFISCFWTPEKANGQDFKGLTIEFKINQILEVKLNGQTTQTANWQLQKLNDGYYLMKTNPLVVQLPGKVLFCENRVVFHDSYVDGCDNYFIR